MNNAPDHMDTTLNRKAFKEFVMDKVDEDNLTEIENNLRDGKINNSNKEVMMDYLGKLYNRIKEIKTLEYTYEGELNLNVNSYLQRIKTLLERIHQI